MQIAGDVSVASANRIVDLAQEYPAFESFFSVMSNSLSPKPSRLLDAMPSIAWHSEWRNGFFVCTTWSVMS